MSSQSIIPHDRCKMVHERSTFASSISAVIQDPRSVSKPAGRKQEFDPQLVADISERVYRRRLNDESGPGADERMVAKDDDGGEKLRGRAKAYDPLTRAYMREIAAAPEMVSVLRELLDLVTEHDKLQYSKGSPIDRTVTRARQIIAKAEGKP